MKLFSAEQIRQWDQYTIENEPVSSVDLMERAATKCVDWLERNDFVGKPVHIFCGKGNNGGDGLAIARLLAAMQCPVTVYILEFGHKGTDDFQINLARLHQQPEVEIRFIQTEEQFHPINPDEIIIDALFGSGLNRGLEGVTAKLVDHINQSGCKIIAIDIPSGLFTDRSSRGQIIIKADLTLSFQCYKKAFLVAENSEFIGDVHILDIGLHTGFYQSTSSTQETIDDNNVRSIYKKRNRFSHKGNFGHALMIAGSYGKMGAAVLSSKACLRSGVGLLSCHIPTCGYDIIQTALPEAMVMTDFNSSFITKLEDDLSKYKAIGIGPGIGTASETRNMLKEFLSAYKKPVVLDADALNNLAADRELLHLLPAGSILTPHPKEFERLFGETADEFERIELAIQKAKELKVIIVLKGHHTLIATPGDKTFFNTTGNAGMATGGSGDVLTGILTGLLAQGYTAEQAAILGVYLHGLTGDMAAEMYSMEAMIAGDIIEQIPEAFLQLSI
ncbi:NAD(P)H-hydrate dehydratase [Terrimonas pollutisoli]|uniref:NAD(P)H-hydrate dehydratase n=1 Tax=Terrimonas pollutisoli TaxID=3034147 RepID=UPI0023EC9A75|nr:NAD(P)H-hydrate dehydratase [Terrimonas sp. H1YJ31]